MLCLGEFGALLQELVGGRGWLCHGGSRLRILRTGSDFGALLQLVAAAAAATQRAVLATELDAVDRDFEWPCPKSLVRPAVSVEHAHIQANMRDGSGVQFEAVQPLPVQRGRELAVWQMDACWSVRCGCREHALPVDVLHGRPPLLQRHLLPRIFDR